MSLKSIWQNRIYRNYLYSFFKDFSFFTAVIVPFFTDWGGLTQFQVQLIQSWFSFWVFFLEIPTGAVADRLGRKHSLAIGSFIICLAVLVYGSFKSFPIFLLSEFLFALGYAFTSGADQALLYDTLVEEGKESESKKILGRADAFHMAGIMVAAPFGSLIAARFGINAPMLASSIPFLLASLIGWTLQEPKKTTSESESPNYLSIVKNGLHTIRRHPVVRTLAIDSVLVSAAAYYLIWLNQPLQLRVGVPVGMLGFTFSLMLAIEIVFSSNFDRLEKIIGTGKKYLKNSALLTSLGFFLVALFPNLVTVFLFQILVAGFGYTRATYIVALASKHIPSSQRATTLSSISMLRRFALVIFNPMIGFVADQNFSLALFLIGILPLTSFFIKEET